MATIDQSQQDQLTKNLDSQVVQELTQQQGFLGAYFTEPENGTGFAITFWENEQDAQNVAQQYQPGTAPMSGALITVVATRQIINVAVSEQGAQYAQQASQTIDSQQAAQQLGS